jgi:hypothetical protein
LELVVAVVVDLDMTRIKMEKQLLDIVAQVEAAVVVKLSEEYLTLIIHK